MFEWLSNLEPWHWLSLGLLLLGAEALGAAGFLLGTAIAAFLVAILNALIPAISWQSQCVVFAISAVAFSFAYWRYFKDFNRQTDHEALNQRAATLIGRELVLEQAITGGQGRIQIGDTFWKAHATQDFEIGDRVKVTAADTMSITVMPVNTQSAQNESD